MKIKFEIEVEGDEAARIVDVVEALADAVLVSTQPNTLDENDRQMDLFDSDI